jgi:uncharacterized protein YndB with AHSA1/START domain
MNTTKATRETKILKDFKARSIVVSRELGAPLSEVWRAYTEPTLLDQWWGPAPWRAETKSMDFRPGGLWLYAMVGPDGQRHWARMDYVSISHHRHFVLTDSFCDANGHVNSELPVSKGQMTFTALDSGTRVEFQMTYQTDEALRTIVEMGFEAGITTCLDQLETLLHSKGRLA